MVFQIRSNPLIYPAGRSAGIDPNHVALRAGAYNALPAISAVVRGGKFIELESGQLGNISGAPTVKLNAFMGPSINFATTDSIDFPTGNSLNLTPRAVTMAAILQFDSFSGSYQRIIEDTSVTALLVVFNSVFGFYNLGLNLTSVTAIANVPYFFAASSTGANTNFVIKNLATGVTNIGSTTGGNVLGQFNNIYRIGGAGGSQGIQGSMATAMCAMTALSLNDLVAWAQDPWSFWYPRSQLLLVGSPSIAPTTYIAFSVIQ